jgi:hypothetical protein
MSREVPIPNPPLSSEEAAAFAKVSQEDVAGIDDVILASATPHWQKVARMVGRVARSVPALAGLRTVRTAGRLGQSKEEAQ